MKLGIHITVPEPISTAYSINPSYQSVCLYVHSPIAARQRLDKNVTAATNAHLTIELLDTSFSLWSLSCQGNKTISIFIYTNFGEVKVGNKFFPKLLLHFTAIGPVFRY
jgi:hypothetical protein